MKRQWKTALFLAIAVLATVIFGVLKTGPTATAANPTTMNFQGKVVNADGTNVADSGGAVTYSILFKLYTVGTGGSAVWTETQSNVTVAGGVFQVNLGVNCSFFVANACNNNTPIDFNANPNLHLGITFNGDAAGEMTPRVQLQSVPFAFNSDKVGGFTAAQLVQLSPGSQQAGFINVSGAGTFGGNLAVTGTYNTNTFDSSSLTFGATATATVQAAAGQALNITGNAASTISTTAGNLTIQGGSGTVTLGSSSNLTATGALTLDSGATTALGVGTGASPKTITVGNVTGATGLVFNSGTAGATFNSVAGGQLLVTSGTNIPTTDQLRIDNSASLGVTLPGVNGLYISYKGGAAAVESAAQRIDLTTGTTAAGIWSGLRVVGAAPSTGVTENLFKGETTAFTQSAANTTNINGFNLPTAGALVQNTAAGTINWNGVNLTTPTITQTTGVVAVNGVQVTIPSSAITTGGTINGFNIPTIATGPAAGTLNGINIGGITTPGAGAETAIKIGNGWDTAIDIGTGFIKANGFNGKTLTTCTPNQTLNGIVVRGGIVTAGNCTNNLTDIAEQYNSFEQLEPGDVVAPDTTYPYVKKTTQSFQANAMGIVSTAPNQVLGGSNPGYPVALIGRVPTKVNLENGPILPGDYVTAASTTGYAMKFSGSGQTIGIALEAYDGSQPALQIEVFVNPGYQQSDQAKSASGAIITSQLTSSGALLVDSGTIGDVSIDSGTDSAYVNIGKDKASGVSISHAGATTSVVGAFSVNEASDFNGPVTMNFAAAQNLKITKDLKIDNASSTTQVGSAIEITNSGGGGFTNIINTPNFTVTGSGDISAKNVVSKNGSFQLIDANGASVVTIDNSGNASFAGNLNIASASLSGGLSVGGDINVAGLSTFQKLATFIGKTIFRQDVQFDGHVTVAKDGAGYATLRSSENTVHVDFVDNYAQPPVVSAVISNGQFAAFTIDKVTAGGFDIKTQAPVLAETAFSWTAIGVNSPRTATNPPPVTP